MAETKSFDTLHVAATLSGIGFRRTRWSDIHECATWLFGDSIWTHELGDGPIMRAVRAEGYRQFPDMPQREEAKANVNAATARILAARGPRIDVARGSSKRTDDPLTTFGQAVRRARQCEN